MARALSGRRQACAESPQAARRHSGSSRAGAEEMERGAGEKRRDRPPRNGVGGKFVRIGRCAEAGMKLDRGGASADHGFAFEHDDADAGAGKHGPRDETFRPASDDRHVVELHANSSSAASSRLATRHG